MRRTEDFLQNLSMPEAVLEKLHKYMHCTCMLYPAQPTCHFIFSPANRVFVDDNMLYETADLGIMLHGFFATSQLLLLSTAQYINDNPAAVNAEFKVGVVMALRRKVFQ